MSNNFKLLTTIPTMIIAFGATPHIVQAQTPDAGVFESVQELGQALFSDVNLSRTAPSLVPHVTTRQMAMWMPVNSGGQSIFIEG